MTIIDFCTPRDVFARAIMAGLLALFGLVPSSAFAQASERALYATVLDEQETPVQDVKTVDLIVREDGVGREILRIEPATEPMQIAVLVDTSAALGPDVANVRTALKQFVKQMAPGNDMSIVEYGDRPSILTDATSDVTALERGIGRIFDRKGSGAYVLEAIVETSRGFQKRESPRPVIVVIDTEGAEFSNHHYERVLDALRASGAALYVMNLAKGATLGDIRSEEIRNRSIVFDQGTRESGGRKQDLLTSLGLDNALEKLGDQLRKQVKVVYSRPAALIPPERITLAAARSGWTARGTPVKPATGAER
jgi:hypothetical protein